MHCGCRLGVCDRTLRRCRCAGAIEFLRMMVDHYTQLRTNARIRYRVLLFRRESNMRVKKSKNTVRAASARGTEERSKDAWTPVEDAVETRIEMCWRRGDMSRCLVR